MSEPEVLTQGKTWRVLREDGQRVVLKLLPRDCLRDGRLHPNVRLRLTRLRELPMRSFVNLIGVDRTEHGVVIVSEYVEGKPFTELSVIERSGVAAGLRLAVQQLHQLGFVHGNLHGGNVIVQNDSTVRLIDPSPLLHDDPVIDLAALARMGVMSAAPEMTPEITLNANVQRRVLFAAVALLVIGVIVTVGVAIHFVSINP